MTISYSTLYTLDEKTFIVGTDKIIEFSCYDENGVSLDISSATITWVLSPSNGNGYVILSKQGIVSEMGNYVANVFSGSNSFTVTLDREDTYLLSGKYVQQLIITDYLGNTYRPAQGFITIFPGTYDGD